MEKTKEKTGKNKRNITIIGLGSWGIVLACLLDKNGHNVRIWGERGAESVKKVVEVRENKVSLPGIKIPESILITHNAETAATDSDIFVYAASSNAAAFVSEVFAKYFKPETIIINASKGFEESSQMRLSEYLQLIAPSSQIAVLTGPSHAEEVSRGLPTAILAVSENPETAVEVQRIFANESFRVYTSDDMIGAELGGA
ncbi:MAG: NAD(P)-binding domain-containing protein, partial [Defluviitaleaceae bacterium]|nr:NAD(P)-binding domain-containing protein [Defluviitaleaceae bacterium]